MGDAALGGPNPRGPSLLAVPAPPGPRCWGLSPRGLSPSGSQSLGSQPPGVPALGVPALGVQLSGSQPSGSQPSGSQPLTSAGHTRAAPAPCPWSIPVPRGDPPGKGASGSSKPKPVPCRCLTRPRYVPPGTCSPVSGQSPGDAEVASFPFPRIAAMQRGGGPASTQQCARMARSAVLFLWGECPGTSRGAGKGA